MDSHDVCRLLDWDSEFFGRRIARVTAHRLTPELVEDVVAWGKRAGAECLYFLADAGDPETVRLAEDHAFRQVDVRLTLERGLDGEPAAPWPDGGARVRPAAPADLPALRALARTSHHDSRFYHDPNFPAARCDDLYATWIEKSCAGYADAVLVADHDRAAAGYVSCHLDPDEGRIGLFAVSAAHQGRGTGRALLAASLGWFAAQGRRRVSVVTQGRNAPAQRLYQHGGFVTRSLQLWYHRWLA